MPTVVSTPLPRRAQPRRRPRVVQPRPRRPLARPAPVPSERPSDGQARPGGPATPPTPEDATLRALFRVAAAAMARRSEARP
jgi:hypothetical protein